MSELNITKTNTTTRPSFGRVDTRKLEETTELLRGIDVNKIKTGQVDEDTIERIKDYVNGIEVNKESKIQGPLKTFALSLLTLGTGMLVTKGTANKFFYMLKDKPMAQKMFKKLGVSLAKLSKKITQNAELNKTAGAARKYFFKALDFASKKIGEFATKGISGKNLAAQGEKLTKTAFNTIGAATGLATTGVALSVDNDDNGRSDILEGKNKEDKKTQKAVLDFAQVVLDAV